MQGEKVIEYDRVYASSTVPAKSTNAFFFCSFLEGNDSVYEFVKKGRQKTEALQLHHQPDPRSHDMDMVHFSGIPWISFLSVKNPRRFSDSIPKIVFGKFLKTGGAKCLFP